MNKATARADLLLLLNGALIVFFWVALVGAYRQYALPTVVMGGTFVLCYYRTIKAALGK